MAKQKPINIDSAETERLHLLRVEYYVNLVASAYDDMLLDMADLALKIPNLNPDAVFTFDDYPAYKQQMDAIFSKTQFRVVSTINAGVDDAWLRSAAKNDKLVNYVIETTPLKARDVAKYFDRNLNALAESRTPISQLSSRVFTITKQFQRVAEFGIDVGIGEGKGARVLAGELMKAVNEPEFTFRRVRAKNGALKWSKAAKKFQKENPGGQGVYTNPRKNYERLTRTEINQSYRAADNTRYNQLDFVVGYEIKLSNNPNHCPMCIALAGKYPKWFKFIGWHPQCRCYMVTILKTDAEIEADNVRILQGKEPLVKSVNSITNVPGNYKSWVNDNAERINKAQSTPYWVRDNYKNGNLDDGLHKGKIAA